MLATRLTIVSLSGYARLFIPAPSSDKRTRTAKNEPLRCVVAIWTRDLTLNIATGSYKPSHHVQPSLIMPPSARIAVLSFMCLLRVNQLTPQNSFHTRQASRR